MFKFSKILATSLVLMTGACVEPFSIPLDSEKVYLVVEAILTDIDMYQTIDIHETHNYAQNTYNKPIANLNVEIIVNDSETIHLTPAGGSTYALPPGFQIQPGSNYQLRFQKADDTIYESTIEKTTKVAGINRIFDEFEATGIKAELKDIPANFVYVDFQDNPNEKEFYAWNWTLWEPQFFCRLEFYDYYCSSRCWEIIQNKDFNVFSDIYTNGKPTYGKLIAKIPYYSLDGALLEIKQQAVSEQAFNYFKLLSNQLQNTGTLVDTPPAAIVGNIKNTKNPNEPVGGIFSVASTVKQKYWLSRTNGHGKAMPITLLGRVPNPPPNFVAYPCLESPTRTPNKPEGWVD